MTEADIIKGNKLIAEFIGFKRLNPDNSFRLHQWWDINTGKKQHIFKGCDHSLEFHTSWDWLMPVIQKIEKTGEFSVTIFKGCCDIHYSSSLDKYDFEPIEKGGGQPKILSTYQAIIEFINWYNKNYKP